MSKVLEGNIIKKANIKQSYSKKQIDELRRCSAANPDGHYYFMENFGFLKHPSKGRMLFKPFDYQRKLIDNYHNYRFSISMLGRQMGKCQIFDTFIDIRNKKTGEIKRLPIGEFFELIKKGN